MTSLRNYFELFKIRQTLLLLVTGLMSYLEAVETVDLATLALFVSATFLAICGTTGINMVLDADIDAIMFRTRKRPIPSGRIDKKTSITISVALVLLGLALTYLVNIYVFAAGLLGFLVNIFLYTILLKRRHPASVVFGGFAGGMPALGGWAAATASFGIGGVLLMLLVAIWSSLHIWTLAIYYADDYRRAGVPMLPAILGEKTGALASIIVGCIVGLITAILPKYNIMNIYATILAELPLLGAVLLLISGLLKGDIREKSYRAFKLASIYMGVVFILIALT